MQSALSVKTSQIIIIATSLLLCLSGSIGHAKEFCFSMAESYYEQIYCEIQSAGHGDRLPSFRDFQNNEPITQALLLKRPASRSGIEMVMPQKKSSAGSSLAITPPVAAPVNLPGCRLEGQQMVCGAQPYVATGNIGNSSLESGVLEAANQLGIPSVVEAMGLGITEADYLMDAYRIYLEKMLGIGLSGATFSYAKFAYFFRDANERGINFAERLETMFHYLKQDKRRIGVVESLPDTSTVDMPRCHRVGRRIIVCPGGRKNLVFVATKPE